MHIRFPAFAAFSFCILLFTAACKSDADSTDQTDTPIAREVPQLPIPTFNRDSAFQFLQTQVEFGPRNPGSPGIQAARAWMIDQMKRFGATVHEQNFTANFQFGESHPSMNIIAQFQPEKSRRILLGAHYDTRYMGEEDPDPDKQLLPIDGADDGASGVAVLMEIARLIQEQPLEIGVDIIFFDAEDQGQRGEGANETWCLGSQYWSKKPHKTGYQANYGILLDMVGAKNAFFNQENVTNLYPHASRVHQLYQKVWNLARAMGKGKHFQNRRIPAIIDDHYFVNLNAGIPMIDIINKPPQSEEGFGPHWHTHDDNLSVIDRNVLGTVGQVVTAVIFRESNGKF